jgi:hypothetical protein
LQRKTKAILTATIIVVVLVVIYFQDDYILGLLSPRPNFEISAAPSTVTLSYMGSRNRTIITVESLYGLTGDIELNSEKGFGIIGIDYTLSPPASSLPANGQVAYVLEFVVKSSVPPGQYYVDVIAVVGSVTHDIRITIQVLP